GESSDVTFAGVAGNRVYLKISGVSLNGGFEVVGLVSPANVELNHSGAVTSVGNIDTTVLPTTGAYKIHIDTYGGPGPTTLTLYDVPPDFTSSMSFGGPSVTVTTTVPGQDGRVSFTGYVNQPIRLRRSAI